MGNQRRGLLTAMVMGFLIAMLGSTTAHAGGVIVVSNTFDTGPGSLRQAVLDANANPGPDTIDVQLGVGYAINLSSGLTSTGALTVLGHGVTLTLTSPGQLLTQSGGTPLVLQSVSVLSTIPGVAGVTADGPVTVSDSTFAGLSGAAPGGAVSSTGDLTVARSTFTNNTSGGGGGGALSADGALTISGSSFTGNAASNFYPAHVGGGAVSHGPTASPMTITDSSFVGNTAWHGGTAVSSETTGTVTVESSTFSGNSVASGVSGGNGFGALDVTSTTAALRYVTFSGNTTSPSGQPLDVGGQAVTLFGVVFAGSAGPHCGVTTSTSQGYNVEQAGASCGLTDPSDLPSSPDPGLGPTAMNGGPTATALPQPGSLLLDRIPTQDARCQGVDQRGVARPQAAGCDVGSVELAAPFGGGNRFHPVSPVRILDSRPGAGNVGPYDTRWGPGEVRAIPVSGVSGANGVPASAQAVALNVTVTDGTAASFLSVWPAGAPQPSPLVSSLNWSAGTTTANAVTVSAGAGGKVDMLNAGGFVNVIVDVVGYYDTNWGDGLVATGPTRILDSRPQGPNVGPYATPWGPGQVRDVEVVGVGGVPANADAVVLNVTATDGSASSHLSVWPAGRSSTFPLVSSLNWTGGATVANAVTAKVGDGGKISMRNASGDVDIIVDVVGYFLPGVGASFHPIGPARIQDSRPFGPNIGLYSTPWSSGMARPVAVSAVAGVPASGVAAVLVNVTITDTTGASFLSIWPAGAAVPSPLVSTLNWVDGTTRANAATVSPGAGGAVTVYNSTGGVDVVVDVNGWYG